MKTLFHLLPHRYPFLLIDRVRYFKNKNIVFCIKNITANDPWLQGHFPNHFIFPAVLMIEAIAQAAIILSLLNHPDHQNSNGYYYITGIDVARFKRRIIPGDQLKIEVLLIKEIRNIIFFKGSIFVKKNIVCHAKIMCKYILN
ncbi:3-hydroxyacyl-ACP dehydratase FabZ [Buchnera aphidicola]|uniref:3-hydroxyacyl-ACP dehydratase FabZ n=1 Tax=Buchnera aphidicola TaxID=9 RepID=UPI003464918B